MVKKKMLRRQPFASVAEWGPDYGQLLLLTLAVLAARIAYITLWHPYGLAPDEAQYWSWLSHNDWSFLTKPPLTTWLMGISTAVFGQTLLGVKLFALLGQSAVSLLGFGIAKELGGRTSAWWAWLVLTTVPLIAAGGLLMTPDAVLLPLWLGTMYAVVRALKRTKDEALCWPRWIIIGVLIGLGGLAKYSAALFFPLLGVFLLVWKPMWLARPQVWVSGLIALAFQLPIIVWNMQNDWVGLSHVLWQAGGNDRGGGLMSVAEFIGGQALVLGPIVFLLTIMGIWRVAKRAKSEAVTFVLVMSLGVMALFTVQSFFTKVQANWPVLGAVGCVLILARWLGRGRKTEVAAALMVGVVVNVALSGILMDTYKARDLRLMPLAAKNDPTKDLRGWPQLGELVGVMMYKLDNPLILSSRYQTLAPMMFHTLGSPEFAYINAEDRRQNQYDLWPLPSLTDRLVVYVNEQDHLPEKVRGMFSECTPWHNVGVEEYSVQTRKLHMWICWGSRTGA